MSERKSDAVRLQERFTTGQPLRVHVLTLSDRVHAGAYTDRGGPRIVERLTAFFDEIPLIHEIETTVLPDDAEKLAKLLAELSDDRADLIVTTGGTGLGPRDITPEVVLRLAHRSIPGIMESIRAKYGTQKPLALLSRSVAAMIGQTLIYTLPGSPKAVDEYLDEITKTLPHALCTIHEIEDHG